MKDSSLKTDMLHTEVKDRDRIGKDLRKTRKNKYLLGKNRGHGKYRDYKCPTILAARVGMTPGYKDSSHVIVMAVITLGCETS